MKILFIVMLCSSLFGSTYDKCIGNERAIEIINNNKLDLRTKSIKGWVRVLKNKNKYEIYNLSNKDREYLINCLINYLENKSDVGRIS